MTHIINKTDLAQSETAYEFEGHHFGDTRVSFIVKFATAGTLDWQPLPLGRAVWKGH